MNDALDAVERAKGVDAQDMDMDLDVDQDVDLAQDLDLDLDVDVDEGLAQDVDLDVDLEMALWVIQLSSDDPVERAQAEHDFGQWQQQHADRLHEIVQLQNFAQQLQQSSTQVAISAQCLNEVIEVENKSQHQLQRAFSVPLLTPLLTTMLTALLTTMLIVLLGCWGYHSVPYYFADYKTAVGHRQSFVLEDGSQITLGPHSAVKLNFNSTIREVELLQGEIYVDVAKDTQRPFVLASQQARFKALGTRFLVQQYPEYSQIDMLHSTVSVQANMHQYQVALVQQGQRLYADVQGLSRAQNISIANTETAWQQRQIVADDLALSDLLTQLNRQYPEYFVYSADALKSFKIKGVIDATQDIDQILALIMAQYPQLKVRRIVGRVVLIQVTAT